MNVRAAWHQAKSRMRLASRVLATPGLAGCYIANVVFCFPCLLFKSTWTDPAWTVMGVRDMKHIIGRKQKTSPGHTWITRSSSHIGQSERHYQLDDGHRIAVRKHNEEVEMSTFTPRFLAVGVGASRELLKVVVGSWVGEPFPGRKSSSVFSGLIFRWCADIHWEMSVSQAEICAATCVSDWGNERCCAW